MPNTKPIGVAYEDQQLDGAVIGASGGTVGFYGTTPVARPATVAAVSTTAATSTTNAFGYTTAEQADAIVTSLNSVIAHLKTLGLIAT
jgi:UDP-N-acetyl-D-mannosaminuronic acid transferase (WecB/TagA/CpsF family)